MRMLMWHVSSFSSRVAQRGRSHLAAEDFNPATTVGEAVLVFASVEISDEEFPEIVAERASAEIRSHAQQLGVKTIVLHSFAHLFGELASAEIAMVLLCRCEARLKEAGFVVSQTPFGWFNTLDLQVKGHPLSRVARTIGVSHRP